jgi:hypothetical protein
MRIERKVSAITVITVEKKIRRINFSTSRRGRWDGTELFIESWIRNVNHTQVETRFTREMEADAGLN